MRKPCVLKAGQLGDGFEIGLTGVTSRADLGLTSQSIPGEKQQVVPRCIGEDTLPRQRGTVGLVVGGLTSDPGLIRIEQIGLFCRVIA